MSKQNHSKDSKVPASSKSSRTTIPTLTEQSTRSNLKGQSTSSTPSKKNQSKVYQPPSKTSTSSKKGFSMPSRNTTSGSKPETIEASSGNVFQDLGLPNPEERKAKSQLVYSISQVIEERQLTQSTVAKILDIDQPKISRLLNGHTQGFSMDKLFHFFNLLGQDVSISITPTKEPKAVGKTIVSQDHQSS